MTQPKATSQKSEGPKARLGPARTDSKLASTLVFAGSGSTPKKPVSIILRRKALEVVARQPRSMRALIQSYGDALERSAQTGAAVRFTVAVGPGGHAEITPLGPAHSVALMPEQSDDLDRALEAARARGRATAAQILNGEDMLSADQFAELIGTSRVTVNAKRQTNQVLGLSGAKRGYRFPGWQIGDDGKPFAALPELFERLGGAPWAVYRFLIQPHPELDGLTGKDALLQGKGDEALQVAESIAHGAFA